MNYQSIKLWTISDLFRFHRYIRSYRIHGTVSQKMYAVSARNTFLLAFALPLDDAQLEVQSASCQNYPEFEAVSCNAGK